MLCMLSFWLLLRQTLTERQEKQKEESAGLSDVHVEDQKKKGKPYAPTLFRLEALSFSLISQKSGQHAHFLNLVLFLTEIV